MHEAHNDQWRPTATHVLIQQLGEDADELVVDEGATPQRRLLEPLDLLLDDDFERRRPDKECR
jgi:hypothetical protein